MIALGLDISTSCIGICLLRENEILLLDHLDLKKYKTLWTKSDEFRIKITEILNSFGKIDVLAIEEPLLGFSKGMSSASTITILMKFNGMTSLISRDIFGLEPTYISAASARKLCGVKLQKTSVAGMSHKEQVFKHMCEHDLSHVVWPLTPKSGSIVGWSRDATDAYVIARAACLTKK